jgi:Holliday junction resolvasome RuvABC endonuclease subunit
MMDPSIEKRIKELYADMKPLMDQFGMKPMTIEERYQKILERKALEEKVKMRPKPRWKL